MSDPGSPRFAILLSTYNGEEFLREQLDSILGQRFSNWVLHVRDDGSADSTLNILSDYEEKDPRIRIQSGSNLGVVDSYFSLLSQVPDNLDYYAFCDQDDFWETDKLSRAAEMLDQASAEDVVMYFSRLEYTDPELRSLGYSAVPKNLSFYNALVENMATGCVMAINATARRLIVSRLPRFALMHDWWLYLVATAFGHVLYDPVPTIRYRQHGGNVLGGTASRRVSIVRRFKSFFRASPGDPKISDQVSAFLDCFGDSLQSEMLVEAKRLLESHASVSGRLRYAMTMKVRRNTKLDSLLFRLLVVLGRY